MLDIGALQYQAENPNLITVFYTVVCAFALGLLLVFTYSQTTHPTQRHNHFMQALVLATIVAATVIQAIGDSVARGLGMLGALSIIRFRTTLRNPRNIVFMFSALAVGIACGVFGFTIAIGGTLMFCATAFLLRFTLPAPTGNVIGQINIAIADNCLEPELVEKVLKKRVSSFKVERFSYKAGKTVKKELEVENELPTENVLPRYEWVEVPGAKSYRYKVISKSEQDAIALQQDLSSVEGVTVKSISFEQESTDVL